MVELMKRWMVVGLLVAAGCAERSDSGATGTGGGTGGTGGTGDAAVTGSDTQAPDGATGGDGSTTGGPDGAATTGGDTTGSDTTGGTTTGGTTTGGTTGGQELKITACEGAPAAAPGADGCAVSGDGPGLLIVGDVLTPGEVFEGGAVLVGADGVISCVGCGCAAQAGTARQVICPDAVISPGLINTHDHVGWMNGSPWVANEHSVDPALRWEHRHDWRKGKNGNPKVTVDGGGASTNDKAFGELRFALSGATAIFGSGDLGGMLRDLDTTGSAKSGLSGPSAEYDTFPLGDSGGEMIAQGCGYPSLPKSVSGRYVPHVSEGINVEARNEFLCLTSTENNGVELLNDHTSIIHGVGLLAPDIAKMAQKGISLVWSPRSNVSLYGDTARLTVFGRMGVNIALGTDWLPSGSMNMLRELRCADDLNANQFGGFFSDEALWRMATLGPAIALGVDAEIGSLATGKRADIAIFANGGRKHHRAVIGAGLQDVILVLKGGAPLVGNAAVVAALADGCDDIGDVCGATKRACLQSTVGKGWDALKTAIGTPSYPLFFCGEPDDEPTCLPARTLGDDQVSGSNLYNGMSNAGDADGDGIADADDLCPNVFDPIRPVDGGKQADFDGDQKGDECDPCPLDATADTNCKGLDPNDTDGDSVPNAQDNCPTVPNADQANTDGDDMGDACDPCPEAANPGGAACPVTIADIKTHKADWAGKPVTITHEVLVTSHHAQGYFVQATGEPAPHGGIFVFTGGQSLPAVGAILNITSAVGDVYFGQAQLKEAVLADTGKTATPAPKLLSAADVTTLVETDKAASPWEGTLCQVKDVSVTNLTPTPGPGDSTGENEFEVTGGLRVDDAAWSGTTAFIDPPPKAGETFGALTGPIVYANELMKLLPRGPADVGRGPVDVAAMAPALTYQRAGKNGFTFPEMLTISLSHAPEAAVTLVLSSDAPGTATVPATLEVPAGTAQIAVPVQGVAAGTTTVRATLQGGSAEVSAEVRVLGTDETPAAIGITPPTAKVPAGGSVTFTVTLAFPAPVGGMTLLVSVEGGVGTAPATVAFAEDALAGTFTLEAAATPASGSVTVDTVVSAPVEVVDASALERDLSGWTLEQTDSTQTFVLPAGTKISGGGYVIVAREADKAAFEGFWGVTLAANVVYINSGGKIPQINGAETYTLKDASKAVVEGPTAPMTSGKAFQRNQPVGAPGDAASWTVVTAGPGVSTPGTGQVAPTSPKGIYISEISDASGTGAFVYEYVEIHFDGGE